jgi:hypothetical protein
MGLWLRRELKSSVDQVSVRGITTQVEALTIPEIFVHRTETDSFGYAIDSALRNGNAVQRRRNLGRLGSISDGNGDGSREQPNGTEPDRECKEKNYL